MQRARCRTFTQARPVIIRGRWMKFVSLNNVTQSVRKRSLLSRCCCSQANVDPTSFDSGNSRRAGKLTFTQHKGRNRRPKTLVLPILPTLRSVIDASSCGDLAFLVNDLGRPFTDAGFGNRFRNWCDQAGLHHRTAHGLRKAGATIAANNGATSRQLMAIFGWETLKEAERYTRAADQQRLAEAAMHLLEATEQNDTE
jgi:integrase